MKVLIFDIETAGHHIEFISHLSIQKGLDLNDHTFYILVNPDIETKAPELISQLKEKKNIKLIPITSNEFEKVNKSNALINSINLYRLITNYSLKINPDHILILHLNIFILSLILFRTTVNISGILFAPYSRVSKLTKFDFINYYRKYIQTKLLSKNKKIKNIYLLNDSNSCSKLNRDLNTNIFKMLPDPIPEIQISEEFDIFKEYNIDKHKKVYLHFGALAERKGCLNILDSIPLIDEQLHKNICFIFAGKAEKNIKNQLIKKINYYRDLYNLDVIFDEGFIANSKMKALFNQCHLVLIPYKNVESSSGILGHAALANKPVIGSESGLLGELITKNKLGYTIPDNSALSISNKINETFYNCKKIDGSHYTYARTVQKFCNTVYDNLLI